MSPVAESVGAELRARYDAGDLDGVLTSALAAYGSELYGFLVGLTRDPVRADDVFSATCERIWKGLPSFRWDSSLRVWIYVIARREFLRSIRETSKRRAQVPLSEAASQAIAQLRSSTPFFRQTEVKDRFAKVREQLTPDEHMLLGLRLDRQLAWNEIARVMGNEDPSTLASEAAALRKQYERLKAKLGKLLRDGDGS